MSETTEAKIRTFITKHFPSASRGNLGTHEQLLQNGIIDSLGVLELVSFMEKTFDITILDEELLPENFETIGRLIKFVESKRDDNSTAPEKNHME